MRKIRISKRNHPAKRRTEQLALDPRDPDIMRAKHLARLLPPARYPRARSRRPD